MFPSQKKMATTLKEFLLFNGDQGPNTRRTTSSRGHTTLTMDRSTVKYIPIEIYPGSKTEKQPTSADIQSAVAAVSDAPLPQYPNKDLPESQTAFPNIHTVLCYSM